MRTIEVPIAELLRKALSGDAAAMRRCQEIMEATWPRRHPIKAKASGDDGDSILCRASHAAPETATGELMFMPAGLQAINAFQSGKEVHVKVMVDRASAEAIQSQFATISKKTAHKVYFDFDHDDKGASFWPTEFFWREGAGVYCRGEWSKDGREAIEGRTYRAFSPVFHVDSAKKNPARIICNDGAALNMGGLVNNPAFKNNLPLWAKDAGKPSSATSKNKTHMKTKAALEAEIQQIDTDLTELRAKASTPEVDEAISAKESDRALAEAQLDAATAREETAAAETQLTAIRAADAAKAVQDAIARGVFGARDTDKVSFWTKQCTDDPKNIAILATSQGRVTLGGSRPAPIAARASDALVGRVMMTRSDIRNVVSNMAGICAKQAPGVTRYDERPTLAREFAAIYAKEIKTRLAEGDDIPFHGLGAIMGVASNTLGTLAQTLVATRVLELLAAELPMLKAITTDFSDQIVSYLDVLKTRYVGIPDVKTYNTSTGFATPSNATTTDVSITYDQWKAVPIQFLGHELAGTVRRLFDELAPAQAYALGDNICDYVLALITSAFTSAPESVALSGFARRNVINIGTALRKRGVPAGSMNRSLLLNSDYFGQLATDAAIVSLAAFQRAEIITGGVLPDVHGFRVIDAPTMPATSISGSTLAGFGFSKSALVLATRLSADYVNAIPSASNGNLTVVTTPGGFSANLVQFVNHEGLTANSRLDVIYGASRGQIDAGQLLLTP